MNIQNVITEAKEIKELIKSQIPYKSDKLKARKVIKAMRDKINNQEGLTKELYKIVTGNLQTEFNRKYC